MDQGGEGGGEEEEKIGNVVNVIEAVVVSQDQKFIGLLLQPKGRHMKKITESFPANPRKSPEVWINGPDFESTRNVFFRKPTAWPSKQMKVIAWAIIKLQSELGMNLVM